MNNKEIDVTKVQVLKDYELYLEFEDGRSGVVDLAKLIDFKGVFEPLKDKTYFSKVCLDPEIGTICWENGADIAPACLYANLNQKAAA